MEAIKNITQEPVRRQVEMLSTTSSTSNTQKPDVDKTKYRRDETQVVEQVKEATNERINSIVEAMDSYVQSMQHNLKIQVHDGTGQIMVQVTSRDTGEVIREFPPEKLLDLATRIEELAGTLFDEKV